MIKYKNHLTVFEAKYPLSGLYQIDITEPYGMRKCRVFKELMDSPISLDIFSNKLKQKNFF